MIMAAKKELAIIMIVFTLVFMLTSCGANSAQKGDKLKVYTTIYPMYDFAKKIGGEKVEVKNLIPFGEDTHHYDPSVSDIIELNKADILIYNGAGYEGFLEKLKQSVENKDLVFFDASYNLDLIFENEEETHDPHTWLSIKNAIKNLENIKDIFSRLDGGNAMYYENNYQKYKAEFEDLYNEYKEKFKGYKNRSIIVSHDAFGYLCKEFGLNQVPIRGINADDEPNPLKMSQIVQFALDNNINTIFYEEALNSKISETIAKEIGGKTDTLYPLETLTGEQVNSGEDYLSVMKKNLDAILRSFN